MFDLNKEYSGISKSSTPSMSILVGTSKCNLSCKYCVSKLT